VLAAAIGFVFVGRQFERGQANAAMQPVEPSPSPEGIREGYPAPKPSGGIRPGLPPE